MHDSRFRVLSLAAALVAWSGLVAPRLPPRVQVPLHAAIGGVLVGWAGAPLGMRPPDLWRGLRLGLPVAALTSAVVTGSIGLPPVRAAMATRELPRPAWEWLLIRIPFGTVWPEEAAYRGALGAVATRTLGPTLGPVVAAATFGLSHVADARAARQSVGATVLATAVAGWAFGWLHTRSGSLAAPMLAHLAINEAGAVAALMVTRGLRRPGCSLRADAGRCRCRRSRS